MATPTAVLWDRDPHTGAKHDILVGYLSAWFPIMAKGFGGAGLTFVDAFAGAGEYKQGEPGSPLLVLSQAGRQEVLQCDAPIRLLFIEKDRRRLEHLAQLIDRRYPYDRRPPQWRMRVEHGTCEDVLVPALRELDAEDAPIFVNFDGFGVDTPMSLVRHVGGIKAAEVLVTFKTQFFIRFAKHEEQAAGDRVFGDGAWRDIAVEGTPQEKKAALLNLYRDRLRDAGFTHILTFELVDEGGHDLLLIFGTSGPLGLEKMKESAWRVDPVRGQRFRDPRDVNQMTLDIGPAEPNLALLEHQLLQRLEVCGDQSLEALKQYTLLETIFKPTHASRAIENLEARRRVVCQRARRHEDTVVRLAPPSLFG